MPKRRNYKGRGGQTTPQTADSAPVSFADNRLARPPLGSEIATHEFQRSLVSVYDILPNPDPILRAEGRSIATYRQMIDGHLGGIRRKRKAAVRPRPWSIEAGKAHNPSVKKLRRIFDSLQVRDTTGAILDAPFLGYAVLEVIWEMRDGWVVPAQVVEKPQEWFGFTSRGEVRVLARGGLAVEPPPRKLLVARHEATYANPYGTPLAAEVFWPLAFKKGGLKFWMMFCEKFGLPRAIGKVAPSTPPDERLRLLTDLVGMVRDAAAVIPNNSSIELLETKTSSGGDTFKALIEWANSEMSKSILGETLTTELQGTGARAAAEVHNEVRADLATDDANLVEATWNQLIRWVWELNRPGDEELPWFQIDMPEDLQTGRLTRDRGLYAMGARFTRDYFTEVYGIDPEHLAGVAEATAASGADPAAFAEPRASDSADQVLKELLAQLSPEDSRAIENEVAKPILDMAARSTGYSEFLELLEKEYANLPMPLFEGALEKFCALSDLAGRSEAASEGADG